MSARVAKPGFFCIIVLSVRLGLVTEACSSYNWQKAFSNESLFVFSPLHSP